MLPLSKVQRWHGVVALVVVDEGRELRFEGRTKWRDAAAFRSSGQAAPQWFAELDNGRRRPFPPADGPAAEDDGPDEPERVLELEAELRQLREQNRELSAALLRLSTPAPPFDVVISAHERLGKMVGEVYDKANSAAFNGIKGVLEAYNGALGALAGRVQVLEAKMAEVVDGMDVEGPGEDKNDDPLDRLDELAGKVVGLAQQAAEAEAEKAKAAQRK